MWTREQIKGRAKRILELNYWKAFLVSLVISIVTAASYGKAEKILTNLLMTTPFLITQYSRD
ncbi:hypothetical protein JTT00_17640 [Clostridium botulinum]|nr:hypothetical protein [Clostridium botulinum]MCS4477281.1 hypothetical protein [Clostridium botulinum]MCS4524635.1 hypothetical protein [Clostridium botulinum]MCS4525740.1 hypothetical protein [Clostridium botulinum]